MTQKTEHLIEELSGDCRRVECCCPLKRSLILLAIVVVSAGAISLLIGLRDDLPHMMESPLYIVEIALSVFVGIMAAIAANWLSLPDIGQKKWLIWLPFFPLAMMSFLIAYQFLVRPTHDFTGDGGFACSSDIVVIAVIPAIALFVLLRKAATTHNKMLAFMAVLSVGAFCYMCLRLICPNDDIAHLVVWHLLPTLVIATVGAFIGSKLLKW